MTLIDDIKRDREAGTPGPWFFHRDELMHEVHPMGSYDLIGIFTQDDTGNTWQADEGNARRIARVPAMEEALLAAVDALKALKFAMGPDGELSDCTKAMELCSSVLGKLEAGQ